jgi:hypothetical protein
MAHFGMLQEITAAVDGCEADCRRDENKHRIAESPSKGLLKAGDTRANFCFPLCGRDQEERFFPSENRAQISGKGRRWWRFQV